MAPADILLNADLLRRAKAVEDGAGRLFRVRTQVRSRLRHHWARPCNGVSGHVGARERARESFLLSA